MAGSFFATVGVHLFFAVVVPDEKGHTDDGQQKLKGNDENVCHDGDFFTGYRFGDTAQTQFSRSDPEALA